MKLNLYAVCVVLFTVSAAHAQHVFKAKFQPGKTYVNNTETDATFIMNFDADSATLQSLKAAGMELPMKVQSISTMTVLSKIGKEKVNGVLPITLEYTEVGGMQKLGGREVPTGSERLNGTKIFGHIDDAGKMHADSVSGGAAAEFKQVMDKLLEQLQSNANFPDRPLKIGDEFVDERPLEMPFAGGSTMKMVIKSKFKLMKVEGNEATFDVVQDLTLDMKIAEAGDAVATGKGKGIMKYNIKDQYSSYYDTNLGMNMKMKVQGLFMTMDGTTMVKTKISMQ